MKQALLIFLSFWIALACNADPVNEQAAKAFAQRFLTAQKGADNTRTGVSLDIAYKATSKASAPNASIRQSVYYYAFNVNGDGGFIIIAGDDKASPVLGYSDGNAFEYKTLPQNVQKWLEGYKKQIQYLIEHGVPQTHEVKAEWERFSSKSTANATASAAVPPLLKTKWDQNPYYNDLSPYDAENGENTVTGCVATAMTQIMKYWNYPETGAGFHSYDHTKYGTLSANFGSTAYDWNGMPNQVTSPNTAVATLMYHVGVSVDMNYDIAANGGSSAAIISLGDPGEHSAEYALKTYFGYESSLKGVLREDYTSTAWVELLKAELDASRPILFGGIGNGGGHAFVADGYDENSFFHFNWGWGGVYDGYFRIDALDPQGVGTGGGSGGYNSQQHAVIGIEPPAELQTYGLRLYNVVEPSASDVAYGSAFSVTTNIENNGSNEFSGDFGVALFDSESAFVGFVEVKTGATLPGGYAFSDNITFSYPGSFELLPGSYKALVLYRPTGGEWKVVGNNRALTNSADINIVNASDIELYADFEINGSFPITQGQAVEVSFNIANTASNDFTGALALALYKLDGSHAFTIQEEAGLELCTNCYYQDSFTFSNQDLALAPGSYLLAAMYKPEGGEWMIAGSTYRQNPVKITVQAAPLLADAYESNDEVGKAHRLPLDIQSDAVRISTSGANCHVGADQDYYMLELPEGYMYSLTPSLMDAFSDEKGGFTLDAIFSYSLDGVSWSDAYDDAVAGSIEVDGGKTVFVRVSPYFTGETGTYQMDISVTREAVLGVNDTDGAERVAVYPNPARDYINIDYSSLDGPVEEVSLLSMDGRAVLVKYPERTQRQSRLLVGSIAEGLYVLQLHTGNGVITKKVIISR